MNVWCYYNLVRFQCDCIAGLGAWLPILPFFPFLPRPSCNLPPACGCGLSYQALSVSSCGGQVFEIHSQNSFCILVSSCAFLA